MYDCLFWSYSQYNIDEVMKSFKEVGPIYDWRHSKVDSVPDSWGIYTKALDDGVLQFYQTGFIRKFL